MKPLKGDQQLQSVSLSYSVTLQALKPKPAPRRRRGLDASPDRDLTERSGEVFLLDILSHRMSAMACLQQLTYAKEYNIADGGTNAAKSSGWSGSIFGIAARWASAVAARIRSGAGQLKQSGAAHSRGPEETRTQFHPEARTSFQASILLSFLV